MQNSKIHSLTISVIITLLVVSSYTNSINGAVETPECNIVMIAKGSPKKTVKRHVVTKKKAPAVKKSVAKKVTKKKRTIKAKRRVVYYEDDDDEAEEEAFDAGHAFGVEDKLNGTRMHECIVYGSGKHQDAYEDGYYDGYFSIPDPKVMKKRYH